MEGTPLDGYDSFEFPTGKGLAHTVYHRGDGPPVLIMHELPGLTPAALGFGRRLAERGFHCYLPLLFGEAGRSEVLGNYRRLCVSEEFARLQAGVSAPVVDWLRQLAVEVSRRHGGASVGAIGMCLTGAFVIPLVLERSVTAPIAAQPGVPFSTLFTAVGLGRGPWMAEMNIADEDLAAAVERTSQEGIPLMAIRFTKDRICPRERLDRLQQAFGNRLLRYELEGGSALRPPHATLTEEYDRATDSPAHPTRVIFETVVAFLHQRLDSAPPAVGEE